MSDFAYAYFNSELDKLDVPSLESIFEKVQALLLKKRAQQNEPEIDEKKVAQINAVYDKVSEKEQISMSRSSMRSMWEAVKNDTW